jgi:hypothetical protein
MIASQNAEQSGNITVGNYTFGVVQTFTYIGSSVSCNNDINQETKKGILINNKCFSGLKNQLKSHVLSWKNKIISYKTLIRPVLTYASEIWVLIYI